MEIVTEDRYWEMLEVLPPLQTPEHFKHLENVCKDFDNMEAVNCFQVGEAANTDSKGNPTFDTFAHVKENGEDVYLCLGVLSRIDKVAEPWHY
jgi:hypothetical protein